MEWKNNNPGRLSGAPLRPSREKTQSAKTAPSPAPAARARARPASFRMSASLHSRRRLFIGYAETRMDATVPPPPNRLSSKPLSFSMCDCIARLCDPGELSSVDSSCASNRSSEENEPRCLRPAEATHPSSSPSTCTTTTRGGMLCAPFGWRSGEGFGDGLRKIPTSRSGGDAGTIAAFASSPSEFHMKDISLGVAEVNSEFPPLNSNGAARSGRASIFVKDEPSSSWDRLERLGERSPSESSDRCKKEMAEKLPCCRPKDALSASRAATSSRARDERLRKLGPRSSRTSAPPTTTEGIEVRSTETCALNSSP